MPNLFHSPSKGILSLEDVAKEIVAHINEKPEESYQLIIGTDSEGRGTIDIVTAIIIRRVGHGGRYFWTKFRKDKIFTLSHKIHEEVNSSLKVAQNLLEELKEHWVTQYIQSSLEIHIDVGENGPTKDLINGVVALVLGCGFSAKTKPQAYGASMVADKYL